MPKTKTTKLSVIIPAKNEAENITPLYKELATALSPLHLVWEVIFIDDGSTDQTLAKLKALHERHPEIKVISFRGNFGKSAALQAGFNLAKGNIIITLDADLQDNPKEIPRFLKIIKHEDCDLVTGWKKSRHDPFFSKVLPSRIINKLTSLLTGINLHDINCGFKAYRQEVVKDLNLYGELYRFIPVLAAKQNYKIVETPVTHRPRVKGQSNFGWTRGIKGLLDLLTVIFLTGYLRRPAHFFGTLGLVSSAIGFAIGLYITYLRITTGTIQYRTPLLFLGILLTIIGIQLFTTGLLAEMLLNINQKPNTVDKYIKSTLT